MSIQSQLRVALHNYLTSGDEVELRNLISAHSEIISREFGEYPDVHRLADIKIGGQGFRICRQISQDESITLVPIEEIFDTPGVPLWLTGEKLLLWASNETENPSDEPTDWDPYR
jgi:hypothetical protein